MCLSREGLGLTEGTSSSVQPGITSPSLTTTCAKSQSISISGQATMYATPQLMLSLDPGSRMTYFSCLNSNAWKHAKLTRNKNRNTASIANSDFFDQHQHLPSISLLVILLRAHTHMHQAYLWDVLFYSCRGIVHIKALAVVGNACRALRYHVHLAYAVLHTLFWLNCAVCMPALYVLNTSSSSGTLSLQLLEVEILVHYGKFDVNARSRVRVHISNYVWRRNYMCSQLSHTAWDNEKTLTGSGQTCMMLCMCMMMIKKFVCAGSEWQTRGHVGTSS